MAEQGQGDASVLVMSRCHRSLRRFAVVVTTAELDGPIRGRHYSPPVKAPPAVRVENTPKYVSGFAYEAV